MITKIDVIEFAKTLDLHFIV